MGGSDQVTSPELQHVEKLGLAETPCHERPPSRPFDDGLDRNGAAAFNVWYRSTTNAGGTWGTTVRLSNLGSGAPYKTSSGVAFTYGGQELRHLGRGSELRRTRWHLVDDRLVRNDPEES